MQRQLGNTGHDVSAIGLGCMGMSWGYHESQRDDASSIEVIRHAVDRGVDFIDTAACYGDGHNERLLGEALAGRKGDVVVATKGGLVVDDLQTRSMHRDARPESLRNEVTQSLRRLRVDAIDLYYLHRVDPAVPLEESWGALSEMVDEGLLRWIGLSEVDLATAEQAHAIHPVTAVQSEMSLWTRDALGVPSAESVNASAGSSGGAAGADVVGWCESKAVSFVCYAPLGRGFLTGTVSSVDTLDDNDFRVTNPRFQAQALQENQKIVDAIAVVAQRHGASAAQVAIAWALAQGESVLTIPGTKRVRYLDDNIGAADIALTAQDLSDLAGVPEASGARY